MVERVKGLKAKSSPLDEMIWERLKEATVCNKAGSKEFLTGIIEVLLLMVMAIADIITTYPGPITSMI